MIISASRRTDIPALYPEWFINRLREGQVLVPNPYNKKKISRIPLSPDVVDCIVFWTKNPEPLLRYLDEIEGMGYRFYFQMTITDYEKDMELNVPPVEEAIATFLLLSEKIGKKRIDWRFDPILLTDKYTLDFHEEKFEMMCGWLHEAANRCIISFVDLYREGRYPELEPEMMEEAASRLSKIAAKYRLPLYTCAEEIDLSRYGIQKGACIDRERIREIIGYKLDLKKDTGQRKECGCLESIDIGTYDTCVNGCRYCYATNSLKGAERKYDLHNPDSPILTGSLKGDEIITDKRVRSNLDNQLSLFDLPGIGIDF